jgi:hypothetical protein
MVNRDTVSQGARYELAVAVDLMRQGFEVFRNLSPAGLTDLIAKKGHSVLLRIQVKSNSGCASHIKHNDVLATFGNGVIRYRVLDERLIPLFENATKLKLDGRYLSNLKRCDLGHNTHDYSAAT